MERKPSRRTLFGVVVAYAVMAGGAMLAAAEPPSEKPSYLYRATFVRAAPGKLLELISLLKDRMAFYDSAGDERPLWWRHTQGDQWDLMLLTPMASYGEYYSKDRIARRRKAEGPAGDTGEFARAFDVCASWREDLFALGPPLEPVKKAFREAAFYHIEIFISLPGKQEELFKERQMESAYQVAIGRPEYMIFVRDQGASWDIFTLDFYRDQKHWAETSDLTKEERDAAARRAGFSGADAVGPYMRTLIDFHRDTMGVAIK